MDFLPREFLPSIEGGRFLQMSSRHSLARLIRTTKAILRKSQHAHSASELTNRKKYYRALARPTNTGDVCLECCAWKPFPLSTPSAPMSIHLVSTALWMTAKRYVRQKYK
ncbi:hypothetical protein CEXT_478161 [Caerostris extrusa]|uniref:Uncharacterized protein n=1 Tax=Caerostris extrusa TaxID=172846 RepID=A0AAV4XPG0_CAEEX|nr:hypothetical protein CEXT_478161 [Caerostris extrusa]